MDPPVDGTGGEVAVEEVIDEVCVELEKPPGVNTSGGAFAATLDVKTLRGAGAALTGGAGRFDKEDAEDGEAADSEDAAFCRISCRASPKAAADTEDCAGELTLPPSMLRIKALAICCDDAFGMLPDWGAALGLADANRFFKEVRSAPSVLNLDAAVGIESAGLVVEPTPSIGSATLIAK
jgi:hypothetical protein